MRDFRDLILEANSGETVEDAIEAAVHIKRVLKSEGIHATITVRHNEKEYVPMWEEKGAREKRESTMGGQNAK